MLDQIVCRFIEHAVNDEPLGDVADRAQWFTEIYQAEALQKVMREETLQERKALQRKEQGLQTQCEQCGQPIPEERLVVLPSATRCVPCQSGREKSNRKK
jgi:DnaK suppressor protein